ncbi:MAG: hypothetical protein R3C03_10950 [Pirellulaceae bacterium]
MEAEQAAIAGGSNRPAHRVVTNEVVIAGINLIVFAVALLVSKQNEYAAMSIGVTVALVASSIQQAARTVAAYSAEGLKPRNWPSRSDVAEFLKNVIIYTAIRKMVAVFVTMATLITLVGLALLIKFLLDA